jgi:hypothetical protein
LASLTFDAVARDPIVLNRNEAGAKILREPTRSREIILLGVLVLAFEGLSGWTSTWTVGRLASMSVRSVFQKQRAIKMTRVTETRALGKEF